jgi:hypothetical protein
MSARGAANSCPKCKSHIDDAYVFDRVHISTANALAWIAGCWIPPKLKERLCADLLGGREHRWIARYRYTHCGYREVYAKRGRG